MNLTAESFCHQNNVVRPPATHQHWHHHWAGEAVACADATAASVLQCTHLSSLPLATLNHLPLRWLTHTHTYPVPCTFTNTNKPNQMCLCANTNVHTQAETEAHTCMHRFVSHCTLLPYIRGRVLGRSGRGGDNHLKALIRIWTVTRLVHKIGEIWVGITIWQLAERHQTSSVISIFSCDSELCDKQHDAASQSVSPSTGNVAN